MSVADEFKGRVYKGGKRNVHRKILNMFHQNNHWHVVYTSYAYTEKTGWYEFGETKQCQRKTFNAWIKEEVKNDTNRQLKTDEEKRSLCCQH